MTPRQALIDQERRRLARAAQERPRPAAALPADRERPECAERCYVADSPQLCDQQTRCWFRSLVTKARAPGRRPAAAPAARRPTIDTVQVYRDLNRRTGS